MDCCGGGVWNTHRAVMKIRCWWRNIRYNNQYKYNKSCRWNRIIYFVHGEFVPKKSREKWNAVTLGILFDYTAILWAHPVHILLHHKNINNWCSDRSRGHNAVRGLLFLSGNVSIERTQTSFRKVRYALAAPKAQKADMKITTLPLHTNTPHGHITHAPPSPILIM